MTVSMEEPKKKKKSIRNIQIANIYKSEKGKAFTKSLQILLNHLITVYSKEIPTEILH